MIPGNTTMPPPVSYTHLDIGCINGYICILGVDMIGNIHRGASGTEVVILPKIDDLTFFGHRIHGKPILF